MAGTKTSDFAVDTDKWTEMLETIEKQRKGYLGLSLTNYDNNSLPAIAAGSYVEINGALYGFSSEEAIGGSPTTANTNYIMIDPTPVTAAWTIIAPTWSDAKNGWYDAGAAKRYIGGCYFITPNYRKKWIYLGRSRIMTYDIRDDAITLVKMAVESIDSDQYVDSSIDTVHLANSAVGANKMGTAATYENAQTRYFAVSLSDPGAGNSLQFLANGEAHFSVNLPDGATVTELYSYGSGLDANGEITVGLERSLLNSDNAESMAENLHNVTGYLTDTSIAYGLINNNTHTYYVGVTRTSHASAAYIFGIRIKYTITKPLP